MEEVFAPVLDQGQVDFQIYCRPGQCRLEPDLVKSLILNLLDNGKKALDGAGELILSIAPTDEGCEIQVADTGRGIPEEEIRKLTEAFYRVDKSRSRAQGGAGLGLSLCNEIARIHQGQMSFQSAVGQGTMVTVLLRGGRA